MSSEARLEPRAATQDLPATRAKYPVQYGSALVAVDRLWIAVFLLSVLSIALVILNIRQFSAVRNVKPLVIRITEAGRADALDYGTFAYRPQEAEIKYFLTQFVHDYYSRLRATVRENYTRSLYFLEGRLADSIVAENKKSKAIDLFMLGQGDEVEVLVRNVAIEDLRQAPFKASVDYESIFYAADRTEWKRERSVAHCIFMVRENVPPVLIPVNPLGLTITYLRSDQAFQ